MRALSGGSGFQGMVLICITGKTSVLGQVAGVGVKSDLK